MNCAKTMDGYLALDKNEQVPLAITLHLLVCRSCRTAVRRMTLAEDMLSAGLRPEERGGSDELINQSLAGILASGLAYPRLYPREYPVSMKKWVVAGICLLSSFVFIPLSSAGLWSRNVLGPAFVIPLYLLIGIAVTAYCGLFIGTNIDFFVKKFGLHKSL